MAGGIERNEWLALVPLVLLAVVYWFRDLYRYNRALGRCTFSPMQLRVLALYLPWVLGQFARDLQVSRGDFLALATTLGVTIVGHYTAIGVLNESFLMSGQQIIGLGLQVVIQHGWTLYSLILFGLKEDDKVDHVCHCANQTE